MYILIKNQERRKHELAFPEYRFQRSTGSHEN